MPRMRRKKYRVLYADPPWKFNNIGKKPSTEKSTLFHSMNSEKHYDVMPLQDLKDMPINNVMDGNSALFLWVLGGYLQQGLDLMYHWGYTYKAVAFVWVKVHKSGKLRNNLGPWTLPGSEMCLLGTRGNVHKDYAVGYTEKQVHTGEVLAHSKKPDEFRRKIERMFPDQNRLELFAREENSGWDVFGNQVENSIQI